MAGASGGPGLSEANIKSQNVGMASVDATVAASSQQLAVGMLLLLFKVLQQLVVISNTMQLENFLV